MKIRIPRKISSLKYFPFLLAFYQKLPASQKYLLDAIFKKIFFTFPPKQWKYLAHPIQAASSSDSEWKFNFDTKQLYSTHKLEIDFVPISFFLSNSLSTRRWRSSEKNWRDLWAKITISFSKLANGRETKGPVGKFWVDFIDGI